jgi:ankyrin repeat protein
MARSISAVLVLVATAGPALAQAKPAPQAPAPQASAARDQALIDALLQGDAAKARQLIEQGASAKARSAETGATAVYLAAERGDVAMVESLIVRGADILVRDTQRNEAPVGAASRNRHAAVVRALLARNAGPDAVPVAAMNAVVGDSPDVMQVVIGTRRLTPEDLSLALDLAKRQRATKVAAVLEQLGVTSAKAADGMAPAILEKYAGRYVAGTAAVTFTPKDGALYVEGAVGPAPFRLAPLAVRYFTAVDAPTVFRVRFDPGGAGGLGIATLRFIGSEQTFTRDKGAKP